MKKYELPVNYTNLNWLERKEVREQYVQEQKSICYYCGHSLKFKN